MCNQEEVNSKELTTELLVRPTTLRGCSFEGLFANRAFAKDELICVYRGTLLRTKEALNLSDKSYLMRLGEQCYVDAKDHLDVQARYINDCINQYGWNAHFVKVPEEGCAYVRATRNISCGEEIFASYGKWYWIGKNPVRLVIKPTINESTTTVEN